MIRFANELIDAIQNNNISKDMEVKLNGCASIDYVDLGNDYINIVGKYDASSDDEIKELNNEIELLNADLNDCRDALQSVCESIDDIPYYIDKYMKMHPTEAKVLSELGIDVLEDFVKTSIDWYNIKNEVETAC